MSPVWRVVRSLRPGTGAHVGPPGGEHDRMVTSADQRLGRNSAEEIKAHPFFAGVDWTTIRNIESPFIPQLRFVCALPLPRSQLILPLAQLSDGHVVLPDRGPERRAGAADGRGRVRRGRRQPAAGVPRVYVPAVRGRAEPQPVVIPARSAVCLSRTRAARRGGLYVPPEGRNLSTADLPRPPSALPHLLMSLAFPYPSTLLSLSLALSLFLA